jgi:membrane protein YqaA with SNARE-associated domain
MAELALFVSAFLAATILPFSSEAAFLVAISNDMPIIYAMIAASSGNILAIILNYFLGYYLFSKSRKKLLASRLGKTTYIYGHKYGYWALLLSWLPFIGDPLTVVAGLVRLKFVWFVIVAGSLRILRYYFLTLVV